MFFLLTVLTAPVYSTRQEISAVRVLERAGLLVGSIANVLPGNFVTDLVAHPDHPGLVLDRARVSASQAAA